MSVERFFSTSESQQRLRAGPLAPDVDGFAAWLATEGYACRSAAAKLRFVGNLSRWLEREERRLHITDHSTFIDEFSYRKRHHYLTLVVDHDKRRVVWAGKGRSAETLDAFFKLLGPSGCERIALVTADLAASWQKALRVRVPHARVVFDRFHVERLASDAVVSTVTENCHPQRD